MQPRIALLTVAIFSASSAFLSASDELSEGLKRIFSSPAFSGKSFGPARWIRGGASFTTLEPSTSIPPARDIIEYDTATGKRSALVPASQLKSAGAEKPLNIEDYRWDQDLKRLKKLGGDAPASSLMFAKFSPDGGRVAYVRANNLYVEDLARSTIRALTSAGSDTLVNGSSDWVYEEQLNLRDGFRWAPDGRNIAFWQFDESGVERFTTINNTESLYPKLTSFSYPKAGQKNSAVRVGAINVSGGSPRWGGRNGFFFVLHRTDGQLLLATPLATVNWATGYGKDGRPILTEHFDSTLEGALVCPSGGGGANWPAASYDPVSKLFYVRVTDGCAIYKKNPAPIDVGQRFFGGSAAGQPGSQSFIRALDIRSGRKAWDYALVSGGGSGTLATAGGLVFFGENGGTFIAVESATGKPLWHFETGQAWRASPMTYMAGGSQYVVLAGAGGIFSFAL